MKYCYQCGHLTAGEPLFCTFCGRSYNVKLCPRQHVNPRYAQVCSQCGSRELSTPQPKVSVWWKVLGILAWIAAGLLLVIISLTILLELLKSSAGQNLIIFIGFIAAILWALWAMLPEWSRKFLHSLLEKRDRRRER